MQITGQAVSRTCAICDRSLLQGERAVRYAPDGGEYVDVCPLCQEIADEYGWRKEGSPTTPTVPVQRRRRRGLLQSIFAPLQSAPEETVASEPILRRLSEPELQTVEAADLYNASDYRRTIAWDITWYQYRVSPESAQPVKLEARGHELADLDGAFQAWNARIQPDGRIVPQIARL